MKRHKNYKHIPVEELKKYLLTQCEFLGQRVDGALMTGIGTRNITKVADTISNMYQKKEAIVLSSEQLIYLEEAVGDSKITFGIQPSHIEFIQNEQNRWNNIHIGEPSTVDIIFSKGFWDSIGRAIGWCPFTICLHYFKHMDELKKHQIKSGNFTQNTNEH